MFLHCMSTASNRSLLLHASSSTISCSLNRKNPTQTQTQVVSRISPSPARDRVIEFGKHRGKMLGTLPSTYLKWVSKNLRAQDFEEWAKLADQVLDDPVYRDRIEWEFAQKVLNGSSSSRSDVGGVVSQLIEISERFGLDNEDKVGWSKIDFGLLGTSKGAPIPRVSVRVSEKEMRGLGLKRSEKVMMMRERVVEEEEEASLGEEKKRRERRERMRLKRGGSGSRLGSKDKNGNYCGFDDDDEEEEATPIFGRNQDLANWSPFPGRESLLKKLVNTRKTDS